MLHGGHFYGNHIAFAMDGLKTAIANLANLMDRQLAPSSTAATTMACPRTVSGTADARTDQPRLPRRVQIGLLDLTAEALKLTMPASVFSRSTECHNQDKGEYGRYRRARLPARTGTDRRVAAALVLATTQSYRVAFPRRNLDADGALCRVHSDRTCRKRLP